MSSSAMQSHQYRYEKKFVLGQHEYAWALTYLRCHAAGFVPLYPSRQVNSLYFDSVDLQHYYEHLAGVNERWKVRIRWYGPLDGGLTQAVLECKYKRGALGWKVRYPLPAYPAAGSIPFRALFQKLPLPSHVRIFLDLARPVLLTSYQREYFSSTRPPLRLTLDHHLVYYPGTTQRQRRQGWSPARIIVELKYKREDSAQVRTLAPYFPWPVVKNSKYVSGLSHFLAHCCDDSY